MKLYHLSDTKRKDTVWIPLIPGGADAVCYDPSIARFPEPAVPRICTSDSLEGCFYAVYPNIDDHFELRLQPYMDFYYYCPVLDRKSKIWSPEYLTAERLVWDAHVTREHDILTPTLMQIRGKVRFFNTTKERWIKARPFNDHRVKERKIAPPAKYHILETYRTVSKEELPASYNW